jgi:hypothetical protein
MSLEQIENTLLTLSPEDRRRFAQWFYEHEDAIVDLPEGDIHPEVQAELLRRRAEIDARPEKPEPWDGTTERVRARLHELRRQKTENH